MKALAHKLNCSTQPIYLSFDSMEALHRALSCEAIEVFLQDISCNGGGEASLYGMEYIRFAAEEKAPVSVSLYEAERLCPAATGPDTLS